MYQELWSIDSVGAVFFDFYNTHVVVARSQALGRWNRIQDICYSTVPTTITTEQARSQGQLCEGLFARLPGLLKYAARHHSVKQPHSCEKTDRPRGGPKGGYTYALFCQPLLSSFAISSGFYGSNYHCFKEVFYGAGCSLMRLFARESRQSTPASVSNKSTIPQTVLLQSAHLVLQVVLEAGAQKTRLANH